MSEEQLIQTPGVFGENDNFLLERELGHGGMGGVYMGRDKMLDRPVAVKVMLKEYGDDPEFVGKFKTEAQSAARLIHPNIAQIYSYGISKGMPYIAMELVAGGSLDRLMQANPGQTEIPRVLKIGEQVAQALRCAADQGIVHGDIKPENILLDANGNAKIVDFGLAGMQKNTDEIWGTPYYIAPEKVKKQPIDYRADMYNLGGTLYHALTGIAPFEGTDSVEVVRERFLHPPTSMREIRPDIPEAVDKLILKMLALEPKDRFPTFEALLVEIKNVMATGLTAPTTPAPRSEATDATTTTSKTTSTGKKKLMVRRGKKMMLKKPGGTLKPTGDAAPEGEGEEGVEGAEVEEDGKSILAKPALSNGTDEEDEEEGGNIGKKVLVSVVGGILAIGLLAGLLVWYQASDKASREAEKVATITKNITSAREAIQTTRTEALKFEEKFTLFANSATEYCEKYTKMFAEKVPEFASRFKPGPSAELLAAIAMTNQPVAAATSSVGTNGVAGATNGVASAVANAAAPAAPAQGEPSQLEKDLQRIGEDAVRNMSDLWERAYSCQAAIIRTHVGVQKVIAECDKANAMTGDDEATMKALGALSGSALELYNDVKGSKDVEAVKKAVGFIKSKGEKAIINTGNELFRRKAEDDRRKKREASIQAAKDRALKLQEEHKALVDSEIEQARTKFEAIQAGNTLKLLAWDTALLQFKFLEQNFKTAEGLQAIKNEKQKIADMKSVQDIFVRNVKGYRFHKSTLGKKGGTVVSATPTEIKISALNAYGKTSGMTITWSRFYEKFHGNLNELLLQFVDNGRKNCKPALSLKEWSDAMCGAALIMRIICAEDTTASSRAEQIIKTVAKENSENNEQYLTVLKKMFPDVDLATGGNAAAEE